MKTEKPKFIPSYELLDSCRSTPSEYPINEAETNQYLIEENRELKKIIVNLKKEIDGLRKNQRL